MRTLPNRRRSSCRARGSRHIRLRVSRRRHALRRSSGLATRSGIEHAEPHPVGRAGCGENDDRHDAGHQAGYSEHVAHEAQHRISQQQDRYHRRKRRPQQTPDVQPTEIARQAEHRAGEDDRGGNDDPPT